jgi:integrase
VLQKAADELLGRQGADLGFARVGNAIPKGHFAVCQFYDGLLPMATRLLDAQHDCDDGCNAPACTVQELLGHKDVKTTMTRSAPTS